MALFGSKRDINLFKSLNRELISNIIEQKVGYYKINLNETSSNIYGESLNKSYGTPVLIDCFVEHSPQENSNEISIITVKRNIVVSFLIDILKEAEIFTQRGDILIWNDDYYEVEGLIQNQFIYGKNSDYNYGDVYLDNFGESFSIQVNCRYVSPDKLNIEQTRI
jgi:hypothetical protein